VKTGRCLEVAHTMWVTPRRYSVGTAIAVGIVLSLVIDLAAALLTSANR
jgi:hypothetical protein